MNEKIRDCILSIKSTVASGAETETNQYEYNGRMMVDEQSASVKITYKEETDEGVLKNLMTVERTEIRITKVGKLKAELRFSLGQKTQLSYDTPYGNMLIPVITNTLEIEKTSTAECGTGQMLIHLMYDMPDAGTRTDMLISLALK